MIAELPGGMVSPICRSSSSLMPLSRTLPQMPPAPAPTAALASQAWALSLFTVQLRAEGASMSFVQSGGFGLRPRRPGVWGKSSAVAGADVWQPLEPARQVPVPVPQELHRRGQQDAAHQSGIEEDRDREADAELLEDQQREGRKDREHGHHDDGRAGDDTGGALDAV